LQYGFSISWGLAVTLPASAGTVVLKGFVDLDNDTCCLLSWRYVEVPFINLERPLDTEQLALSGVNYAGSEPAGGTVDVLPATCCLTPHAPHVSLMSI